jgi:ankyrin repeat protein
MAAAEKGDQLSLQFLLGKNAEVNSRDQHGKNALNYAIENGHEHLVQLLRQAGSKP